MPPKSLQVLSSLKIVTVRLILCSVHISSVLREPLSSSCFHLVHPRPHRPSWRGTSSRSIIRQKTPVQARDPNLIQNATLFAPIVPHIFYLQKKLITPQPRNPNMQSNLREENPPNHEVEKKEDEQTFISSPAMIIMMYNRSIYFLLFSFGIVKSTIWVSKTREEK